MKKKLVTGALLLAFGATAVTGGTLAYFTDKTEVATNTFTVGNIKIALHEATKDGENVDADYQAWLKEQTLIPTTEAKKENTIDKVVTVENTGVNDAYMWAEIWVPSALDDGDDNSPAAPGKGNSLHFNYASNVVETKSTYLGSKDIDGTMYNGYVHYVKNDSAKAKDAATSALLDHVYMDAKVTQCEAGHDNCLVLMNGNTHYTGNWELKVYGVGIQGNEFATITEAITAYYDKDVTEYIW